MEATTRLALLGLAGTLGPALAQEERCDVIVMFNSIDPVQAACCSHTQSGLDNPCTHGSLPLPGQNDLCYADCKPVYTDFWNLCGDYIADSGMDPNGELAIFAETCLQPPPPPPGETCARLELEGEDVVEGADQREFDPCTCPGDTNSDYLVTTTDIMNVMRAYGMQDCRLRTDFTADCVVDIWDLTHVLDRFGNDCTIMNSCRNVMDTDWLFHEMQADGDGVYQVRARSRP
eukprot:SAG11_NODE_3810_length_2212_cov_1.791765_3_plen_232_part_00